MGVCVCVQSEEACCCLVMVTGWLAGKCGVVWSSVCCLTEGTEHVGRVAGNVDSPPIILTSPHLASPVDDDEGYLLHCLIEEAVY